MIRFENTTIRLDGFCLEHINLHVSTGAYAVLMGRTGCGKTTVLEAACGLRPVASGRIHLMGRDVTNMPPGRRGVGLVPQDGALFATMTIEEHLAFALRVRKRPRQEIANRVAELADWLGIEHLLHRRPQGLSGGERQRVAVGRAMAAHPDVLFLDEPLSALDEETHGEMIELLRRVHRQTGVTVLHITHNQREARALAQSLIILRNGQFFEGEQARDSSAGPGHLPCHY
jgi:molybdate/tungstate transport system ATP-binding protein